MLNKVTCPLVRHAHTLNRDSGITAGLFGAIQRLVVNGNSVEDLVGAALDSRGIQRYFGPPCDDPSYPGKPPVCQNGGVCHPNFRSFTCKCPRAFIGSSCQQRQSCIIIIILLLIIIKIVKLAHILMILPNCVLAPFMHALLHAHILVAISTSPIVTLSHDGANVKY